MPSNRAWALALRCKNRVRCCKLATNSPVRWHDNVAFLADCPLLALSFLLHLEFSIPVSLFFFVTGNIRKCVTTKVKLESVSYAKEYSVPAAAAARKFNVADKSDRS